MQLSKCVTIIGDWPNVNPSWELHGNWPQICWKSQSISESTLGLTTRAINLVESTHLDPTWELMKLGSYLSEKLTHTETTFFEASKQLSYLLSSPMCILRLPYRWVYFDKLSTSNTFSNSAKSMNQHARKLQSQTNSQTAQFPDASWIIDWVNYETNSLCGIVDPLVNLVYLPGSWGPRAPGIWE